MFKLIHCIRVLLIVGHFLMPVLDVYQSGAGGRLGLNHNTDRSPRGTDVSERRSAFRTLHFCDCTYEARKYCFFITLT